MRHVRQHDIDSAAQAIRSLSTGQLTVHDAMFEIAEASDGLQRLQEINDSWRNEVESMWGSGIDVPVDHPCVQRFIVDYSKAVRDLAEMCLPF